MTKNFFFFFVALCSLSCAQLKKPTLTTQDYFNLVRSNLTGELAYNTTAYAEQYWRVVGNDGFNKTIHHLATHLEAAGFVSEEHASPADRFTYRIEKRPLQRPTWEILDAAVFLNNSPEPLLRYESNRNMVYLNSVSTPQNGATAEVVHIENIHDLQRVSVKGKIIFTESNVQEMYKQGVLKQGALGLMSYDNPSYLQPEKNSTSIQFRSLDYTPNNRWGIALSFQARETLKSALSKGRVYAKVKIASKIYPSEELTLVANIKGAKIPNERLVFSAHVQEPGANDNASGTGAQLEMATVLAQLIKDGSLDANRSLTFLWGDEIIATQRYILEDKKRAAGIKWGLSLDMVGENTAITGGSFLIEKMPDPSAIWTRGKDKHTEWGGRTLTLEDMQPHYLNDFTLYNFKNQAKFANWTVNSNPYEGGSDHSPFLQAKIPGLLFWHFTDQFYHTDNDRLDKVSHETLKNVGTAALATALTLVNGDSFTAMDIVDIVKEAGTNRLADEFLISERQLIKGKLPKDEVSIIQAWGNWYLEAIAATKDLAIAENNKALEKAILEAQNVIESQTKMFIAELEK
ncbi:M28 family peptidase [Arenibacter aquaticus]|uniref:M28 family peptidase n=1 Tax=Arenibacter aquaticus TaxID=2489054 RepID=A0A430K796_9FLAO|nr:M28 family peptidase [Arenibacter aquaticus]RTE54928.1 M28 family peptidase [Arenibacter aquaticus]